MCHTAMPDLALWRSAFTRTYQVLSVILLTGTLVFLPKRSALPLLS